MGRTILRTLFGLFVQRAKGDEWGFPDAQGPSSFPRDCPSPRYAAFPAASLPPSGPCSQAPGYLQPAPALTRHSTRTVYVSEPFGPQEEEFPPSAPAPFALDSRPE